ncbi:GTP-binding protein [Granulicella rosea]|uniref:GTPase Der n=1 Tax=Granulicella rosea TaxID=474952 RepID=A0A239JLZ6_9BACT|nr:ribosome biogenesis GTPase Der [Granulicella rosea]SNT06855.1 GTP-binding protein [Granulicella rosea]
MAVKKDDKKRLGKKHRQASTRPKKGRSPKSTPTTGATRIGGVAPKKRKVIATKAAEEGAKKFVSRRSPEFEAKKTIAYREEEKGVGRNSAKIPEPKAPRGTARTGRIVKPATPEDDWREAELLALQQSVTLEHAASKALPLVAICGRPNVGKSTLFNRLTDSRRSIVGDEPGITRDRIYGQIEWAGRDVRIVDTGGVVPDDEALIPSEIFRQAQVALEEADAVVMVVDGRTELASPDMELARLLLRGGKPTFLAVNKIDNVEMQNAAQNFRRLGFRNVMTISAEHGHGIGDLLDAVYEVLPEDRPEVEEEPLSYDELEARDEAEADAAPIRKQRTHGEYESRETKVAIIGRPNVGKSTLLNALTETNRAIVSPIAGTTRDAVDEIVERKGHLFRFVDTAGIRRKGKTKLMAEKLSVIMARKHLEAADVSLLVIDATEGVTGIDANIGGYAHESGRSVIIVINKWDLVTTARTDGKPPVDQKVYAQQVRDALKYLEYAPLLFISAAPADGDKPRAINEVFAKVELVARERRKRVSTGQMNKFLEKVDFQRASVPMNKRVKIYYMTQAQVAPPTFVLFTDKDVKMHFSFERFLANQIRENFGFIGSPIWFKIRARNKKKVEE